MKRKLLLVLSLVFVMITTLVCAVGCKKDEAHKHTWATEWSVDGETHWHACTGEGCTAKKDEGNHEGGTANCTDKKVCTVCDNAYGEVDSSVHKSDEFVYVSNGDNTHTKKYKCCNAVAVDPENCSGGIATVCGEKSVCEVCHAEYGEALAHSWKTEYKSDGTQHWRECSRTGCTAISEKEDCSGGTATCTAKAICTTCGNEHGDKNMNNHSAATYKYEANNDGTHKKIHTCCNAVEVANEKCSGEAATVCGEKNVCEYCKAEYGDPLAHDPENHAAKAPTCTEIGWDAYVTCKRDGCTYTTYREKAALGHDWDTEWTTSETQHWHKCNRTGCDAKKDVSDHDFAIADKDSEKHWKECACGAKAEEASHALTTNYSETQHWKECECGYETAKVNHTLTDEHDETQHWQECECGYKTEKTNHVYSLIEGEVYDEYSCECGFENDELKFKKTVDNIDKDIVLSGSVCSLDLTGVSDYASVESIKLIANDTEIDLGTDINALSVTALISETQKHGKQTLTVVVKTADDFSHTVLVPVVIVTKEITTMTELQDSVKWLGGTMDNIYGYYTLGGNVTTESGFSAKNGGISYSSGKAFRGTLDGRGFSVTFNSSAAGCGLFGTMNGATVKDITIIDSWNNDGNRPMLAYNAYKVTFEKVKLVIKNGKVKGGTDGYTPIVGASMHACTFRNVEITSNVEIVNIFYDAQKNIFESLKITADITGKFSKDIELADVPDTVTIVPKTAA